MVLGKQCVSQIIIHKAVLYTRRIYGVMKLSFMPVRHCNIYPSLERFCVLYLYI